MSFWKDKKVLVTGGAGFVGSHLVERLVEAGAFVTAADDFSNGRRENLEAVASRVEILEADVGSLDAAKRAAAGKDIVVEVGRTGLNASL